MKLGVLSKKPVKAILCVSLVGFIAEVGGYIYGLQLSDVAYYHFSYKKDKGLVSSRYGIEFPKNLIEEDYPANWKDRPLLADQTEVVITSNQYDRASCLRTIKREIENLPVDLMKKSLNAVYCLDKMIKKGTPSGGTYSSVKKSVYIVKKNNSGNNLSKWYIRETFHHELSSIFMENYSFNQTFWRSSHGEGFQYEKDKDPTYSWMFLHGHVEPVDKEILHNRGLLNHYSETGVENDFNTYAEIIFVRPSKMKKLIKEYPIIKRKYEVFKDFYLSIDSGFSPVFEKIDG